MSDLQAMRTSFAARVSTDLAEPDSDSRFGHMIDRIIGCHHVGY